MNRKETVYTSHGEIEYDLVSCANCEIDVRPQEAVHVVIGRPAGSRYWSHKKQTEVDIQGKPDYRALCEYCGEAVLNVDESAMIGVNLGMLRDAVVRQPLHAVFYAAAGVTAALFFVAIIIGVML